MPNEPLLLSVTPKQARTAAEQLLKDIGANDMMVDRVELLSNRFIQNFPPWMRMHFSSEEEWVAAGSPEPEELIEKQAYKVSCLRTFGGVTIASDTDSTYLDGTVNSPSWRNEKLLMTITDTGIVGVDWPAPLDIKEILSDDAIIKPFSDIKNVFEKMMFVMYEPDAIAYGKGTKYRITRVQLSLQRISDSASFDKGLLIPVWNFYGQVQYGDKPFREETLWPLMTINAIDGTVIDLHKGY